MYTLLVGAACLDYVAVVLRYIVHLSNRMAIALESLAHWD